MTRNFTYDVGAELSDGATITATANGEVATVAKVLDVGAAVTRGAAVVYISAAKTSAGNETYTAILQGDTSSGMGSAVDVAQVGITGDGVYEIPFINRSGDDATIYRYLRIRFVLAGTSPSLTIQGAGLAPGK